jgi:hypothetical protein
MLKIVRNILLVATATVITLLAADPIVGTWKLNVAKSKFTPGPAPKSQTNTYTSDGDWIIGKNEVVNADGKVTVANPRYKRDGKEYPYQSMTGESGTIVNKALDANTFESTIKAGKQAGTTRTVVSKDGKTFTRTIKGTDPQGRQVNNVLLFEKQ